MGASGKLLLGAGFLVMAHAALSVVQQRHYVRLMEQEFLRPSTDIVVELFLGAAVCVWGVFVSASPLVSIHAVDKLACRTWESLTTRAEFRSFNHRGRALGPNQGGADPARRHHVPEVLSPLEMVD